MSANPHSTLLARPPDVKELVLESYGNGFAWFRPSTDRNEPEDALYWITDLGRRHLRMAELFGCEPES